MEYDQKDDGLRRAYKEIRDEAAFERVKALVQKFDNVTRGDFLSQEYQQLLWEANPICRSGRVAIDVDAISNDKNFLNWFYDEYQKIRVEKSKERTELLCEFVDELLEPPKRRMHKYSAQAKQNMPLQNVYRALAALFPENFTCLASRNSLSDIASQMDIKVNKYNTSQVVKGHCRILDRFIKALGEPGNLDEVIQQLLLPWRLPDATSQEEPGENLDSPSDEGQRPDDSMTSVEVHVPQLKDILPQVNDKGYFPDNLCQKLHFGLWADERRHFAVLTGLSGAGKTLLASAYAEAITGEDPTGENPERSCIVAVQPGWTDPSYLLGYANPLQNDTFEKTPFLELLLCATDKPHMPHVAILDEMNLSHPEQYMAPLLSAMETGGSIEIHGRGEKFDGVPQSIKYPNNLVLIGTVNMDETTHGLVDKILDRAFTLEFWKVDVEEWPGWKDSDLLTDDAIRVKAILKELMDALEPARLHFGYRVIKEIVAFLTRRQFEKDSLDWQKALDSVIYAKVLPKLRGDDSIRISDALKECKKVLMDREKHGFILSDSENKVGELIKDLKDTGSARFWR